MNAPEHHPELFTPRPETGGRDVEWFIERLRGRGWILARELLVGMGQPVTEAGARFLRDVANHSHGEIASGNKGYKLVREMTAEEHAQAKARMLHQCAEMQRRVIEMDRVFFQTINRAAA